MSLTDRMMTRLRAMYGSGSLLDLYRLWRAAYAPTWEQELALYRSVTGVTTAADARYAYWGNPLADAVFWVDAGVANGLRNLGTGGEALDPIEGGVPRARILRGRLNLPGTTGNGATVADHAAIHPATGQSFQIDFDIAPSGSIAAAGTKTIISQIGAAAGNYGWQLFASATALAFSWSADGTNFVSSPSCLWASLEIDTAPGARARGRMIWRGNNGSGNWDVRWYSVAEDGTATLVETDTGVGTSSIFNSTANVEVGARTGLVTDFLAGAFYRVSLGVAGSTVLDLDFNQPDMTRSFVCPTGQTVTIARPVAAGDPLHLPRISNNEAYIYQPGISAGNYVLAPATVETQPTDQFEIIVRVAADDWTPASSSYLFAKGNAASARCARITMGPAGGIAMALSTDGALWAIDTSVGSALPFSDGQFYWLNVSWRNNDGTNKQLFTVRYAADTGSGDVLPDTWTTHGTRNLDASFGVPLFDTTVGAAFGSVGGGFVSLPGEYSRMIFRRTIGGANDIDIRPADIAAAVRSTSSNSTLTDATGKTITVGRATSGRKTVIVTRPVWLFGTDDYMEIPNNALLNFGASDSGTVVFIGRQWGTPTNFGRFVDKYDGTVGWTLSTNGTTTVVSAYVDDGPDVAQTTTGAGFTAGNLVAIGMTFSHADDFLRSYVNGTQQQAISHAAVGDMTTTSPVRIGRANTGANYQDFEMLAVAVFRRALTAGELAAVAAYYGAS